MPFPFMEDAIKSGACYNEDVRGWRWLMNPISNEQFSEDYQKFVLQKQPVVNTVNYMYTYDKKFSLDATEKKNKKEKDKKKKEDSPWLPKPPLSSE